MILSSFDRACTSMAAGKLMTAVDWAIAKAVDDGAIAEARTRARTILCTKCDDTGYKDHAGFAMDACDHG